MTTEAPVQTLPKALTPRKRPNCCASTFGHLNARPRPANCRRPIAPAGSCTTAGKHCWTICGRADNGFRPSSLWLAVGSVMMRG